MGGDVALTLGRHHPDRVSALVVTGYSPFAAAGEEAAEMAAWAADLQGGMEGFVAGYERRHGPLPDDARARWLANDGAALAACVASMIAESDGSQVADLPAIETPVLLLVGTEEPFAEQARASTELLPNGTYVLIQGLDHVQMFCPKRPCRTACPGVFRSNSRVNLETPSVKAPGNSEQSRQPLCDLGSIGIQG